MMQISKFRIGDLCIGNDETRYSITRKGVVCRVLGLRINSGEMRVEVVSGVHRGDTYWVEFKYFDKWLSLPFGWRSCTCPVVWFLCGAKCKCGACDPSEKERVHDAGQP